MKKIKIFLLFILFVSCSEKEKHVEMKFKVGDRLCVLDKEVEIWSIVKQLKMYNCRYIDNHGIIQQIYIDEINAKLCEK